MNFSLILLVFLLTPRPWGIEDNYSFLLFLSILHWLLFTPSLIGGLPIWFLLQGATRNIKFVYHIPHKYVRENQ